MKTIRREGALPLGLRGILPLRPRDHTKRQKDLIRSLPLDIGAGLVLFILIIALVGPALTTFSYSSINTGAPLSPPDPIHWFGTDALGRDLFSRVIHGLRTSLWISVAATLLTSGVGIGLGLLSGYYQGWIDLLISRLVDVLLSLPGLLLALVLIARLGPSLLVLVVAIGLTGIPAFYRVARSETLSMKHQPFVEASLAVGQQGLSVIYRHIFPNIFPILLIFIAMRIGTYLLMGSGLSFIGLGIQPPEAELGALLAAGKDDYQEAWWLMVFPGGMILMSVLGLNLLGEGLRDQLDHVQRQ